MKNWKSIFLLSTLFLGAATTAASADTISGQVSEIWVSASGSLYIKLAGGVPLHCGTDTGVSNRKIAFFASTNNELGAQQMLKVLLAAKLSGKAVTLWTTDADYCPITSVTINN